MTARPMPAPVAPPLVADSPSYARFAAAMSMLTALAGLGYAIAFLVLHDARLSALALMLVGLLSSAVLVALYDRARAADASFALWGFLLAAAGALGTMVHGAHDLAIAVNPIAGAPAVTLNAVDPRGVLTFGATGLALLVLVRLARRSGALSAPLAALGTAAAGLGIVLYLGRLIVLDPASPVIAIPALAAGFLVNPAWYLWLGIELRRAR